MCKVAQSKRGEDICPISNATTVASLLRLYSTGAIGVCFSDHSRGAGYANRAADRVGNGRREAGTHAHVLALHDLYFGPMRPVDFAQVTGEGGRGRAGCGILVNPARVEGIARVKMARCFGPGK